MLLVILVILLYSYRTASESGRTFHTLNIQYSHMDLVLLFLIKEMQSELGVCIDYYHGGDGYLYFTAFSRLFIASVAFV